MNATDWNRPIFSLPKSVRWLIRQILQIRRRLVYGNPLRVRVGDISFHVLYGSGSEFRRARRFGRTEEPEVVEVFTRLAREARVVYDIGAATGLYALLARKIGAQVVAFEPEERNHHSLMVNRSVNRLDFEILPYALGAEDATMAFERTADVAGLGRHRVTASGGDMCQVRRLDGLVKNGLPVPNVLKIDVEGYEVMMLAGASETLRVHRPHVILELHPKLMKEHGHVPNDVYTLFAELGYDRHDLAAHGHRQQHVWFSPPPAPTV